MVIDTSAVVAVLLDEPEGESFARAMLAAPRRYMSAFSELETAIVISARKGAAGKREWDLLAHEVGIDVIPFDSAQQQLALEAWNTYGKGHHEAALNIGDCCSYALAVRLGEPLLFKGNDFAQTDITPVAFA
ncbi:MAG: type II toxin-antitoxin system VapC family toxin [Spirochaetales bacterium]